MLNGVKHLGRGKEVGIASEVACGDQIPFGFAQDRLFADAQDDSHQMMSDGAVD
jgi:hypothetical protein